MLTKEERAAIAERLKSTEYITSSMLFRALTGEEEPSEKAQIRALCVIRSVILDLCDTSNMIELPVDKDGEVIHIGDTVYDDDNLKYEVVGYMSTDKNIILKVDGKTANILAYAETLTHKQPVTVKTLVERIKNVMNDDSTTVWAYDELDDIAEQLERLGDSDD